MALRVLQSEAGRAHAFAGALLSAPALKVDPTVDTAFNRWLGLTLTRILPKLPVAPLAAHKLCTDASVVEAYKRDPLVYHGSIRVRTGAEVMLSIETAFAEAPDTRTRIFIAHGGADAICPIDGSRKLVDVMAGRATLTEYANAFHEILQEPAVAARVTEDAIAWINARLNES